MIRMFRGLKSRCFGIRCLAVAFGAFIGLMTSLGDQPYYVQHSGSESNAFSGDFPKFNAMFKRMNQNNKAAAASIPHNSVKKDNVHVVETPVKKAVPFVFNSSSLGAVVNPHPFEYTIEPTNACKDTRLFLVAYVHTSPDHQERRTQIRQTWGNSSLYKDVGVEVYFMVGKPATDELQQMLIDESHKHQDIVQESYVDAYHNLSYKAIGAMKWVSTRCSHTKFILKTDDDVFINTFALIKHLRDLDHAQVSNKGLLMCLVWYRMHVLREGKWRINESVIPDEFYPHYCSGMGYILTPDVAKAIYQTSAYVRFFWVDDVYITGMIPKAMNLTHIDIVRLFMGRKEIEWLLSGNDWHKYLFSHLRDQTFYYKMWALLEKRARTETIPDMKPVVAGEIATDYGPKKPPDLRKKPPKKDNRPKPKAIS